MILPAYLQEKIENLLSKYKTTNLKSVQKSLTSRYKQDEKCGKSLIESQSDSILYAVSRMPATYSVVLSLLSSLKRQGLLGEFSSACDVGSGTGAGWFALGEFDENLDVSLFERDQNMIKIFGELEPDKKVQKFDLLKDKFSQKFDLVMTSYVLSELAESQRELAAKKLFDAASKYLLIIDTGTPKVWADMMKLKQTLENLGGRIIAPCQNRKCPLENDYCQFFARVERSSIHRMVKNASLSYEDEKYFYLLVAKEKVERPNAARIIRRPVHLPNQISLKLCTSGGIVDKTYSKRDKEAFKIAKKAKINDLI